MLTVTNVGLAFGDRTLLDDVSFQISSGEKVGLVGVNGAGKSTLLKIVAGQSLPDRGEIEAPAHRGYLPQEPRTAFRPEQSVLDCLLDARGLRALAHDLELALQAMSAERLGTVLDESLARYGHAQSEWERLGGYEAESEARRMLDGLGMGHLDFSRRYAELSGGQKTRLALAALLFSQPDLLLLDEPTNHLDRVAAGWLMDFLASYSGTVLLISHDLALLDRAISRVLHLDERTGQIEMYRGNYTKFIAQREARRIEAEKQARLASKKIDQLQVVADRFRAGTRATMAKNVDRRIERLRDATPSAPPPPAKGPRMAAIEPPASSRIVLEVKDLWKAYDQNIVLTGPSFALERGQTLALLGPNGAGKTTLLKVVAGRLTADDGRIELGRNVRVGYYAQEHEALNPNASVLEEARQSAFIGASGNPPPGDGQIRTFLGSFLFTGSKILQSVGTLSGGERTRLALAKLFLEKANLLLLDEPTNNLDVSSQEALLEVLGKFGGSVIIVCHATDFVRRLAPDRAIVLPSNEFRFFGPELLGPEKGKPGANGANGRKPKVDLAKGGGRGRR